MFRGLRRPASHQSPNTERMVVSHGYPEKARPCADVCYFSIRTRRAACARQAVATVRPICRTMSVLAQLLECAFSSLQACGPCPSFFTSVSSLSASVVVVQPLLQSSKALSRSITLVVLLCQRAVVHQGSAPQVKAHPCVLPARIRCVRAAGCALLAQHGDDGLPLFPAMREFLGLIEVRERVVLLAVFGMRRGPG